MIRKYLLAASAAALLTASSVTAQQQLIGLGDSIGEGVQSADASLFTQPSSYLNLIAGQIGSPFPLPLIVTTPLGLVGDTTLRFRLLPFVRSANLAVSGADVNALLREPADALGIFDIDTETDLVLFPRTGSQIEIVESLAATLVVCWIGNNDILGTVLAFDQLDASQLTPIADFSADFTEIAQRLDALGTPIVFANIPDVTDIGFLIDRQDMIDFVGQDFGLQEGDFTTIVVMLLIKIGRNDGSLIQNPDFVLDAAEVVLIQERTAVFNQIIADEAAKIGMPVVDVNGIFAFISENPRDVLGVTITSRFLGGLFSLDGVHPSDFGHALLANAFLQRINADLGGGFPLLSRARLGDIFRSDPYIDKDGDGVVTGRPLAGLLETLGPTLGISGDTDDALPAAAAPTIDPARGRAFARHYEALTGERIDSLDDAIAAMRRVLALDRWGGRD